MMHENEATPYEAENEAEANNYEAENEVEAVKFGLEADRPRGLNIPDICTVNPNYVTVRNQLVCRSAKLKIVAKMSRKPIAIRNPRTVA